jgi:hypothetical protein
MSPPANSATPDDRPGGSDRVNGVGLAVTAAGAPAGPVDLDNEQALLTQPASQPRTPTPGALDTDTVDDPEVRRPRDELMEPAGDGRDGGTHRSETADRTATGLAVKLVLGHVVPADGPRAGPPELADGSKAGHHGHPQGESDQPLKAQGQSSQIKPGRAQSRLAVARFHMSELFVDTTLARIRFRLYSQVPEPELSS